MSLPWGVKETVASEHADKVGAFIADAEDSEIIVSDKKAKLLKFGMKEIKGQHLLIFRYQLQ